jgi:thioredoxin reductase
LSESNDAASTYETLIVGAGPAGLQLGALLERDGRDYRILEAGATPGTFFRTHPRHRKLITGYDDPEINLRWDWNSLLDEGEAPRFTTYSRRYFPSADTLVEYLCDFAVHHGLKIDFGVRVARVARPDGRFLVETGDGRSYRAGRLVMATGVSALYVPPIPGIELAESYDDAPTDPEDYAGQHVLILGKGNSGFETAGPLIETAAVIHLASPESIKMAWQTHYVGHLRALNNDFLDTYQLKCQNAVLDARVDGIRRRDDGRLAVAVTYSHASGEREELVYDRVINCTGFRFDDSIFDQSCRPELVLDDRFPAQTSTWESTNVPDLFFAGTLMQVRDYKKTTSSFIHGFRYNVRTLHRLLERRYHDRELPFREVPPTERGLVDAVMSRVNRSSALWQQFGYLADAVLVDRQEDRARYYEELPLDWLLEGGLGALAPVFAVTLEFGEKREDPFRIERTPSPEMASDSAFLHPVIRCIEGGEVLAELHLLENLYGEWKDEAVHREPLLRFFEDQLRPALAEAG